MIIPLNVISSKKEWCWMTGKMRGLLAVHLAVLLFGMAGLFGKLILLTPLMIVLGRTFFASLSLGLVLYYLRQPIRVRSRSDFWVFFFLGSILAIHWTTFFHAIQISTVAVGLLTFSTFPMFVTFMEPCFFGERLRLFDILTALLVFCGLVLVIPAFDFGNRMTQGALWGTVSGFTFAVLSIMNRKVVRAYAPPVIAFYQNAFASLLLLPFFSLGSSSLNLQGLLYLVFLGVFCTAVAHALFIRGLKDIHAQAASVVAGLEPVYGILFALVLLGEVPNLRMVIGGIIILGTTILAGMRSEGEP